MKTHFRLFYLVMNNSIPFLTLPIRSNTLELLVGLKPRYCKIRPCLSEDIRIENLTYVLKIDYVFLLDLIQIQDLGHVKKASICFSAQAKYLIGQPLLLSGEAWIHSVSSADIILVNTTVHLVRVHSYYYDPRSCKDILAEPIFICAITSILNRA